MDCAICAYESEHFEWPLVNPETGKRWGNATHCNDCHRTWSAKAEAHCTICCQHFTSDSVAVLHESYCTADRVVTAEAMAIAHHKDDSLIFDVRQRKSGLTWVRRRDHGHYRVA